VDINTENQKNTENPEKQINEKQIKNKPNSIFNQPIWLNIITPQTPNTPNT
jgi:hypothetical protein